MRAPPEKVVRIPGVVPEERKGAIGCTMAHINTLEHFLETEYDTCVIFEDDFKFIMTPEELDLRLQAFWDEIQPSGWEVLMLAGRMQTKSDETRKSCWRVNAVDTTSAYAVTREMAPALLANFKEGLEKLRKRYNLEKYALDEYWKRIQPDHLWYAIKPLAGTQRESYSDINFRVKEVKSFVRTNPSIGSRHSKKKSRDREDVSRSKDGEQP